MLRNNGMRAALLCVCAVGGVASGDLVPARAQDGAVIAVAPGYLAPSDLDDAIQFDVALPRAELTPETPTAVLFDFDQSVLDSPALAPFALHLEPAAASEHVVARWRLNPDAAQCDADVCSDEPDYLALRLHADDVGMRVGAQARIADRVSSLVHQGDGRPRWYLYLAADTQAMTWAPRGGQDHAGTISLDDMRLVGDAQAGVGTRVGGGDLAIGYFGREVSHMGASRQENFVGLTYGWSG